MIKSLFIGSKTLRDLNPREGKLSFPDNPSVNLPSNGLDLLPYRPALSIDWPSREKVRKPRSLLWGGMASGGLGAAAPIMAFSLESPLGTSHRQAHEIK